MYAHLDGGDHFTKCGQSLAGDYCSDASEKVAVARNDAEVSQDRFDGEAMQRDVEGSPKGQSALVLALDAPDDPIVAAPPGEASIASVETTAAPASGAVADREDVQSFYNFFLRRDPENDEVWAARTGYPIAQFLSGMLLAEEFQRRACDCLSGRLRGQKDYTFGPPRQNLLSWATKRLGFGSQTAGQILRARTWVQVDLALLRDESVQAALAPRVKNEISAILGKPGLEDRAFDIAGSLDIATSDHIEGWCCDCADLDKKLAVEIWVENEFAGTVVASDFRRDLLETIGADGRFAFSFTMPAALRGLFSVDRWIVAREASSRRVFGKALCPKADVAERFSGLEDLRRELSQIKAATERIETALPGAVARLGYALEDYPQYYAAQYAAAPLAAFPSTRSEGAQDIELRLTLAVIVDSADPHALRTTWASIAGQSAGAVDVIFFELNGAEDDFVPHFASQVAATTAPRFSVQARRTDSAKQVFQILSTATTEYVGFLRAGDRLSTDALARCAAIAAEGPPKLIYSDEDTIAEDDFHKDPILKPDFDLDYLLTTNYIGNSVILAREALAQPFENDVAAEDAEVEAVLFECVVRTALAAGPKDVRHIPRILYHNRDPKLTTLTSDQRRDILNRCLPNEDVQVEIGPGAAHPLRLFWRPRADWPTVSVIVPTRDKADLLRDCLQSVLQARTEYKGDVEVVVVDNDSAEPGALDLLAELAAKDLVRVMPYRGRFNWSAINNCAAKSARGEALIFLNNDTRVLSPGWFAELATQAMRPDVGAVGAMLLYADGTIQHGGTIVGCHGVAAHDGVGAYPGGGGYMGRLTTQRSVGAVTGACLATRKALWESIGGFDEIYLQVAFNDTDYCMRVRERGLRVIYTPYASAYHFESKSRGLTGESPRERAEARAFRERWGERLLDPYYNAHFERYSKPFTLLRRFGI